MTHGHPDETPAFLSTLPPGRWERRLAMAVVLVSIAIFLAAAPFAKVQLPQVWAFIPIYQSALVVNDLITAVLLFGQFRILRSRALLLRLPLHRVPRGRPCALLSRAVRPERTARRRPAKHGLAGMFWHAGFPLLVIAYAIERSDRQAISPARVPGAAMASIAGVIVAAVSFTLLATAGQDLLPAIMHGNRYTPAMILVVSTVDLSAAFYFTIEAAVGAKTAA